MDQAMWIAIILQACLFPCLWGELEWNRRFINRMWPETPSPKRGNSRVVEYLVTGAFQQGHVFNVSIDDIEDIEPVSGQMLLQRGCGHGRHRREENYVMQRADASANIDRNRAVRRRFILSVKRNHGQIEDQPEQKNLLRC